MKLFTLALVGLLGVVGVVAYAFLRPPPAATGPIEAVALEQTSGAPASATVFEIEPEQSQERFVINEVLRGSPKTVVGTTDQVAGQIVLDPTDPDRAQLGAISINARTFATDSTQRDRAIQNLILQTEQHEYITFTPKRMVGLPDRAGIGQPLAFQIVGDLSIRGVTREATFETTVTPHSQDRLEGNASTTIRYADWGITIPQVPAVTGVADHVQLQLDFVATAA
jgi:polyisoprenoid-binding protein YceI